MSIVICDQGTRLTLEAILNKTAGQNFVCKLFKNSHTPVVGDTEANYTEATFSGYAALTLAGGTWTTTEANPSTATYAAQTFLSNANQAQQTIYGYYLVQLGTGKLIGAELLATPVVIQSNTDSVAVTPGLTMRSA